MKYASLFYCFLVNFFCYAFMYSHSIIGLMQVKNEEDIIEYSLRALAYHTDAIIVLDDNSEDNTLEILKQLAPELHIVEIITNTQSEWIHGSEVTNRQKLLDAGRKHGGTHFIEIDADEVFTTHCAENNWLREKLLSLKKGQILQLPLINLWKSFDHYRSLFTNNFPNICYCTIGYCDDGESDLSCNLKNSHPGFLHFGRFPHKSPTEDYELFVYADDINRSIIHLPFINWTNVIAKKVWIMMLEVVRLKEKLYNSKHYPLGRTKKDVSNFYEEFHNYDDENITLSDTPTSWLDYPFFKKEPYLTKMAHGKIKDIQKWVRIYGKDYFDECPYIKEHLPSLLEPLKVYISGWAPEITSVLIKELENHNMLVVFSSERDCLQYNYLDADIVITINIDPNVANTIESHNQHTRKKIKLYSLLLESAHIDWQPYNILFYKKYDLIFTLDDTFINHSYFDKYVKIDYPQRDLNFTPNPVPFSERKLLTLVNSYKIGYPQGPTFAYDLYHERLKMIEYFTQKEPSFDFYGQLWETSPYASYSSCKGKIKDKLGALQNYKFILCFENSCHTPGYITEKIFDAFIAGIVPIYWGAPNVTDYIPQECFIDMRKFTNLEDLHNYLLKMSEEEYKNYIHSITSFLNSERAHAFLNTEVASKITQNIAKNLN